ncbi:hypothetical protein L596_017615 [Steinernema carpocapsae]|uniref:Uncharacterized protein n=1 Tax=Steinernema carpocapsae TaxID=34508 RepID=A0A4U5N267_STECR|nr:hypothetical protein L596_017615 [Steinernema carpocapsae]
MPTYGSVANLLNECDSEKLTKLWADACPISLENLNLQLVKIEDEFTFGAYGKLDGNIFKEQNMSNIDDLVEDIGSLEKCWAQRKLFTTATIYGKLFTEDLGIM